MPTGVNADNNPFGGTLLLRLQRTGHAAADHFAEKLDAEARLCRTHENGRDGLILRMPPAFAPSRFVKCGLVLDKNDNPEALLCQVSATNGLPVEQKENDGVVKNVSFDFDIPDYQRKMPGENETRAFLSGTEGSETFQDNPPGVDLSGCEATSPDNSCLSLDDGPGSELGSSEEDLTVPVGDCERAVARAKLQCLLNNLGRSGSGLKSRGMSKSTSALPRGEGSPVQAKKVGPDHVEKSLSFYEMSEYEKSMLLNETRQRRDPSVEKSPEKSTSSRKINTARKFSSLQTGQTGGKNVGRRKIVRFADVFGLDLADVKTFLDEVPRVPKSAFRDLKDANLSDTESDVECDPFPALPVGSGGPSSTIVPLFNQLGGCSDFLSYFHDRKVSLESAYMVNANCIKATVRVLNLDFNKKVFIRYTVDEWQSTAEVEGHYLSGSSDGFSDKFIFLIDYSKISGKIGKRLQFCVKFECVGLEFWDNNGGTNYIFQVFGSSESSKYFSSKRASSRKKSQIPLHPTLLDTSPLSSSNSFADVECENDKKEFLSFSHSTSANDDPWLRYL